MFNRLSIHSLLSALAIAAAAAAFTAQPARASVISRSDQPSCAEVIFPGTRLTCTDQVTACTAGQSPANDRLLQLAFDHAGENHASGADLPCPDFGTHTAGDDFGLDQPGFFPVDRCASADQTIHPDIVVDSRPIPEPASLVLAAIGLLLMGVHRKRPERR